MKTLIAATALLAFTTAAAQAQYNNTRQNPDGSWTSTYQGGSDTTRQDYDGGYTTRGTGGGYSHYRQNYDGSYTRDSDPNR